MSGAPVADTADQAQAARPLTRRELRALAFAAAAAAPSDTVAPLADDITNLDDAPADNASAAAIDAEIPTADADDTPAREHADAPLIDATAITADEFSAAARLFGTSSERIIGEVHVPIPVEQDIASHVARGRRRNGHSVRRIATTGLTLGVTLTVGALAVALALPSGTLNEFPSETAAATTYEAKDIQAFIASENVEAPVVERNESYEIETMAEIAAAEGINYSDTVFNNDLTADIQWPFKVGVDMSYGYGMRSGRMHEGIDFTPGSGAPIQAIADGVVRIATESGGGYGVTAYVDHVIDGQVITSHYSHMQYGSLNVEPGDVVKVGDVIGLTGDTGFSFGAHLHFELLQNGETFDPMPWLEANAGRHFDKE